MLGAIPRVSCLAALLGLCASCAQDDPGGYAAKFEEQWARCSDKGLFEVKVEATEPGPDGWTKVELAYEHGLGENYPSETSQAVMLAAPNGTTKNCILLVQENACLCGGERDW